MDSIPLVHHSREEGSLDYDGGFVRLQIHLNFDTNIHRQQCVGFGHGEFVGRSFTCGQYKYGENDRSFKSQRSYGPRSPLRGTRSPPRGCVGVPPRRDRMDFANPTFEKMARHRFDSFCTNPSAESFAHSHSHFLFYM
jgi:hypothetical protein